LNPGNAIVEAVDALLLTLIVSLVRPRSVGDRVARFWRR